MIQSSALAIDDLIVRPQYSLSYDQKQNILIPLLEEQVQSYWRTNLQLQRYCERLRFKTKGLRTYEEVPFMPVTMFKKFELLTVPRQTIIRTLTSSGTTGAPSKIFLDRPTSLRQSKAAAMILKNHLGGKKRPFLVLDAEDINQDSDSVSARGAAIRGLAPFASDLRYGLKLQDGELVPDLSTLTDFFETYTNHEILIFGFTYIIWTRVVSLLKAEGVSFHHKQGILLHSGGWKRLTEIKVEKNNFQRETAAVFGIPPEKVVDFYGMVEAVGVIFPDCEAGHKHTPNFAEVVLRDVSTLGTVRVGESGLVQVLSVLPGSYPGQSILTEDIGTLLGYDDCPCGRLGTYFQFKSRAQKAEVRGCGDTFSAAKLLH